MIREDALHFDEKSRQAHTRKPSKDFPLKVGEWVSRTNNEKSKIQARWIGPLRVSALTENSKVVRLEDRFGKLLKEPYNENLLRRWPGHACHDATCEDCYRFAPPGKADGREKRRTERERASRTANLVVQASEGHPCARLQRRHMVRVAKHQQGWKRTKELIGNRSSPSFPRPAKECETKSRESWRPRTTTKA